MELVFLFRRLWRRRLLAVAGVVVAAGAGQFLSGGSTQGIGTASTRLAITTSQAVVQASAPASQSNTGPPPNHAPWVADLLATGTAKREIAGAASIPADQLAVVDVNVNQLVVATPLPTAVSQASASFGARYTLLVNPSGGELPVVELDAEAPDRGGAERLLVAARQVLTDLASGSHGSGLIVTVISPSTSRQVERGPRKLTKVITVLMVFLVWCFIVLAVPDKRRWRRRSKGLRRFIPLGGCALIALVGAFVSISKISLLPPHLERRDLANAGAQTHILVDTPPWSIVAAPPTAVRQVAPPSTILDPNALSEDFDTLTSRASLLGGLLTTPPLVAQIAHFAGVSPNAIYAYESPIQNVPIALSAPSSEKRATELVGLRRPDLIEIQVSPHNQVLGIFTQAPTPAEAQRLAQATVTGLDAYLQIEAKAYGVPQQTRLWELGQPEGAILTTGTKKIAVFTFIAVFILAVCALGLVRRVRGRLTAGQDESSRLAPPAPPIPARVLARMGPPLRRELSRTDGGMWPRTTRVLPWLLAAFMAMVWLVPFDAILLNISLPITFPLDRLFVPVIIGVWLMAFAGGRRVAPRMTLTWIHAAVGAFMTVALLSVVLNAPDLNHTQELMDGLKRIPLFASYLSVFFIVASVVRPEEVRAFMKFTFFLAVILAIGMIVQYRFNYNVFYTLSEQLLPGVFTVTTVNAGAIDGLGRRLVQGSAGHPLEAVAMLCVGVAIAVVMFIETKDSRHRIGYGLALCLMLAAMVTTYRKSALLAPLALMLAIGWFRPRQVVRMAPLGLIAFAAIHALAPGAFGAITTQLSPTHLNVPTVDDRVFRYDAVRPDVWSHLLFGRGLGTYNWVAHRILDSEALGRLIETGVLGLVTYFLMMISVVVVSAPVIKSRDPNRAPLALACAAAAVSFAVISTFYDATAFPHGPYLFLCMAGFAAILATERKAEAHAGAPPPSALALRHSMRRRPPVARGQKAEATDQA